jgi:hypothetical protein
MVVACLCWNDHIRFIYIYVFERSQLSSLLSGDLFPLFTSHAALDRFPTGDTLSGSFPYILELG